MGIEDEIRGLLSKGFSPRDVVNRGYSKSTVYKVYSGFTAGLSPVTAPQWHITWHIERLRYFPGEISNINFSVLNSSGMDLYVYRTGLRPEWLKGGWYTQEGRFLLRPGESKNAVINIPIPSDLALGEYEMTGGLDAQFVGPGAPTLGTITPTQWAEPFILEVKKPLTGYKVFISHSTLDMNLVRQLQRSLDKDGIEGIVAEDLPQPGISLEQKFKAKIQECNFFIALLTSNGARSNWVIQETNYALSINKPNILMKEKETQINSTVEWVEFSRSDPPEAVIYKAQKAFELVSQQNNESTFPLAPVAIGVLAFLFGLAAGKSKKKES